MRPRQYLKLASLAILLWSLPATAHADNRFQTFYQLAVEHWGEERLCTGARPTLVARNKLVLDGRQVTALWTESRCEIALDRDYSVRQGTFYYGCLLTVHELGHALGHEHNEGGIMADPIRPSRVNVPVCARERDRRLRAWLRADDRVYALSNRLRRLRHQGRQVRSVKRQLRRWRTRARITNSRL